MMRAAPPMKVQNFQPRQPIENVVGCHEEHCVSIDRRSDGHIGNVRDLLRKITGTLIRQVPHIGPEQSS